MTTENLLWPNDEIRHAGWSLLGQFQDELFAEIEKVLMPLYGKDWFHESLPKENWKNKKPEKELYVLLKETVQSANQNFRLAIATSCTHKQFLTKAEIESLEKILYYRNKWSHEPSETNKRITRSELRDLAINIKNFAVSEGLKVSCDYAIGTEELGDLIFSLPVVARHLPTNAKNKAEIFKVSELIDKVNLSEKNKSELSPREIEFRDALEVALHGWQKTDLRLELLLVQFRLLQTQILAKIHVDSNRIAADDYINENFEIIFKNTDYEFELHDKLSEITFEISKLTQETLEEIASHVEDLVTRIDKYSEIPEDEKCKCQYCKIVPTVLSPFEEKDTERIAFIQSRIFGEERDFKFLHFPEHEISDSE